MKLSERVARLEQNAARGDDAAKRHLTVVLAQIARAEAKLLAALQRRWHQ